MTSPDATPTDPQSDRELRAELSRVDAERSELLRQAHELRIELAEGGPIDGADRAAIMTQAEELELFAAALQRRRDALSEKLEKSP